MTWLDDIREELKKMDIDHKIQGQMDEVLVNEYVVGELNDELKRIHQLAVAWRKAALQKRLEAEFESDKELSEKNQELAFQFFKKSEILTEIFWISVKDHFDLWDKPAVGLRKDWKIVWFNPNSIRSESDE